MNVTASRYSEELADEGYSVTQPFSSRLHPFAQATAGAAFLLLIAGGLVTSTGSSLSVPDWPLSYGRLFPPMLGGVLFEHGHRLIAGTVAIMTVALTLWVRATETRAWVRGLAYAASGAIFLQALLGGLTVLLRLPPVVSVSHACLGQTVFCLLLLLAQATSPWFMLAKAKAPAGDLWKSAGAAAGAVFIQLLWGAILRHTGEGLYLHLGWALMVVGAISFLVYEVMLFHNKEAALTRPAALLGVLVLVQLSLGYGAFRLRYSGDFETGLHTAAAVATAHVAVGALILGTCVVTTLRALRLR